MVYLQSYFKIYNYFISACECNEVGSMSQSCDFETGICNCTAKFGGAKCDLDLRVDIKKNYLIKTYPKWGPSYKVEFNIFLKEYASGVDNIFHLTANKDCCDMGDRIPIIFRIFINNYSPFDTYHIHTNKPPLTLFCPKKSTFWVFLGKFWNIALVVYWHGHGN